MHNKECMAMELATFETETGKTSLSMVIAKYFGDERFLLAEGSTAEAIEHARTRSTLPVISDDSENAKGDHKQYVRAFNSATRATVSGGSKQVIGGLIVNKNLKRGMRVHEKVSAGGRRQLFVPMKSTMLEEEETGETVKSKLAFVKALRGKDKPRGFLAKMGGTHFFGTDDEESNFEKDFLEASIKLSERKPNYGKRKLLNSSLLFTLFLLVKREYEESEDPVVKEMWEEIFVSENTFFEWVIAELDRADEVEEMLAEEIIRQGSSTKKKRQNDGVEGELEENVAALCDLFENDSFLEKGKIIKVFKEPYTKTLTLAFRNQLLRAKLDNLGRDHMLFKAGDAYAGSKMFTKEDALKSFGEGNTGSAQCICIKLRTLPHELRERVLVVFDDHGFIYDEDVEEAESRKEDSELETLSQQSTQSQTALKAKDLLRFCRFCPFSTRKRPELEEHMKNEHEACSICKRAFKGGEELMKHIQEDHNRSKCPKCQKMIASNAMARHSEEHATREKIAKGKKVKKPSTAAKKKNPYIEFCRLERKKIKDDHPMLLPGQVNAELGRRWKELSREEQEEYRQIGEDAALVEVENEREDEIAAVGAALEAGAEVEAALVEVQREREDEIAAVEAALEAGAEVEAALEAGTAEVFIPFLFICE